MELPDGGVHLYRLLFAERLKKVPLLDEWRRVLQRLPPERQRRKLYRFARPRERLRRPEPELELEWRHVLLRKWRRKRLRRRAREHRWWRLARLFHERARRLEP